MNPLWIIVGFFIGATMYFLVEALFTIEWRPRRCQRNKPCGCKTFTNGGCGLYRYCEDAPPKKDQNL